MTNFFITKFSHISMITISLIFLKVSKFLEVYIHGQNSKDI